MNAQSDQSASPALTFWELRRKYTMALTLAAAAKLRAEPAFDEEKNR